MKKSYFIGCILLALLFASCSSDNGNKSPAVRLEMLVAEITDGLGTTSDGSNQNAKYYIDRVLLDSGREFKVVKSPIIYNPSKARFMRAVAYLEVEGSDEVIIHSIAQVPIAKPLTSGNVPVDMHRDPVKVSRVWIGGGFLNIQLGIKTVDLSKHNILFTESSEVESKEIVVSFFHNRNNEIEGATKNYLVSIPLDPYLSNSYISLRFLVNSYDGEKEYFFDLNL